MILFIVNIQNRHIHRHRKRVLLGTGGRRQWRMMDDAYKVSSGVRKMFWIEW